MVFWKLFCPNTLVYVTDSFDMNYIIYIGDFRYKDFDIFTMVFVVTFWPNTVIWKKYSPFFPFLLISGYFEFNAFPECGYQIPNF